LLRGGSTYAVRCLERTGNGKKFTIFDFAGDGD
jgi:hypothetical protein